MIHARAIRLLPVLLDPDLSPRRERALRAHVRGCARCADRLREFEQLEALVRGVPRAMVPLDASAEADHRLRGLARWFPAPEPARPARAALPALGVAAVAFALVLSVSLAHWSPLALEADVGTRLAAAYPDSALLPMGWR